MGNSISFRLPILFGFIYNFGIYPLPRSIRSGTIVTGILILYLLFTHPRKLVYISREFFYLITSYMALISLSALQMLRNSPIDYSFTRLLILMLIFIIGAYYIIELFYSASSVERLIKDLVLVIFIQALIVIIMVISPSISKFIQFFSRNVEMLENGPNLVAAGQAFRGNGLSGALFWDFGLQQSIGTILIAWLIKRQAFRVYYVIAYLVILFSVFLTSRTGLLGVAISFIILAWPINHTSLRTSDGRAKHPVIKFLFTVFIIVLPFLFIIDWQAVDAVFKFAFELFLNYIENGEFTSTSTSHLGFYFPPLEIMLLGEGRYGDFYAGTDSGYIRQFVYWGFCSLLFYLWFLWVATISVRGIQEHLYRNMLIFIWILFFAIQVKGDFFVEGYQCLSIILLFLFFNQSCQKNKISV